MANGIGNMKEYGYLKRSLAPSEPLDSQIPSGNQTWQSKIPYEWMFEQENNLETVHFPLPCLITGR